MREVEKLNNEDIRGLLDILDNLSPFKVNIRKTDFCRVFFTLSSRSDQPLTPLKF